MLYTWSLLLQIRSITFCTFSLFFSSFFLIQLRACCWGSIHMGNRLPLVVRIPFCTDSSSGGKPSEPHLSHSQRQVIKKYLIHIIWLHVSSYNICPEHTLLTCWFLPHPSEGFLFWKAGLKGCLSPAHPSTTLRTPFHSWSPSWRRLHSSGKQQRSDSHPGDAHAAASTPPALVPIWVETVAKQEQRRETGGDKGRSEKN